MSVPTCPFCAVDVTRVFHAGDDVVGLWDAYAVSPGHALLVPRRHVATWFDATDEERQELTAAVAIARAAILQRHQPDGFNIGINVGAAAGQTVFHLHVHVIPRYTGDVGDPRGGVRHVVPAKGNYLAQMPTAQQVRDSRAAYRPIGGTSTAPDLFSGGVEHAVLAALLADMDRAARIDLAVSFVFESGLDLIEPHLIDALNRDATVRILAGDYQDVTDPHALRRLLDLEGRIERRIFEARDGTSFHPKAYIFVRTDGEGVAYVGSSNLSATALQHGIEWNYRVAYREDAAAFAAVRARFEALFHHPAARPLDTDWIASYERRRRPAAVRITIEPEPGNRAPEPTAVQREALVALDDTRAAGNAAGLVVMATGLGKTYLSAFDSRAHKRVLFVAHREEILSQAIHAYRAVRPDDRFGRYTGDDKFLTPTSCLHRYRPSATFRTFGASNRIVSTTSSSTSSTMPVPPRTGG